MELNMRPIHDFTCDRGSRDGATLARVIAIVALTGLAVQPARAQITFDQYSLRAPTTQLAQASVDQPAPARSPFAGIEVLATPYLWVPWTSVGVNPSNSRIPSASGTVDPGQLFSHLTWVPFMGEVEFREGPYGVILDYMHAPLKAGINTSGILFGGAGVGLGIDMGTAMFLYRAVAQPDQYVDVGAGVRAWGLEGNLSLNQGLLLPAFNVSNGTAWADPLIAARFHRDFGNGWGATAYGDVGGFGVGAHIDWQVIGTIDYQANSWIDLHGGFRSLNFSYSLPRSGLDVNMNGPILAATFHF
jgi:hypothetical protein